METFWLPTWLYTHLKVITVLISWIHDLFELHGSHSSDLCEQTEMYVVNVYILSFSSNLAAIECFHGAAAARSVLGLDLLATRQLV